jgi:hypothetical protein
VIGKGAFGEVRYCRLMIGSTGSEG